MASKISYLVVSKLSVSLSWISQRSSVGTCPLGTCHRTCTAFLKNPIFNWRHALVNWFQLFKGDFCPEVIAMRPRDAVTVTPELYLSVTNMSRHHSRSDSQRQHSRNFRRHYWSHQRNGWIQQRRKEQCSRHLHLERFTAQKLYH